MIETINFIAAHPIISGILWTLAFFAFFIVMGVLLGIGLGIATRLLPPLHINYRFYDNLDKKNAE